VRSYLFRSSYFLLALIGSPLRITSAQDEVDKPRAAAPSRPAAPTTITTVQEPDGSVRISWSAVRGAVKYSLVRSVPVLGIGPAVLATPTDTFYVDSDIRADYYHFYMVNGIGETGVPGMKMSAPPFAPTRSTASTIGTPLPTPTPTPRPPDVCTFEYRRADNMWAPLGVPEGNLGVETITVKPGRSQYLKTDWKYEKLRNDGTTYYGTHLRIARNRGKRRIDLRVTDPGGLRRDAYVNPGETRKFQHDVFLVKCLG
jgi:hypothetical protein